MGQKKKFNYVDFILKYLSVILMIIALIYIGVNYQYFASDCITGYYGYGNDFCADYWRN